MPSKNFYASTHHPDYPTFDDYPVYEGNDLGLTYSPEQSTFKVWSPAVKTMTLFLYEDGHTESELSRHSMTLGDLGVWSITLPDDQQGKYYNFQVTVGGRTLDRVPDPYAKATGLNGARAMILDFKTTDPPNWAADQRPEQQHFSDIILYEAHVRDLSAHPDSGIQHKRKFLGLTETGTTNAAGQSTGLDHIKDLGITHIHLLPSYDFLPTSVDEAHPTKKYNWGYDPQNYNVPEGAYATDPYDGAVRIREFKQMVQTFHQNDIRVILDVVYNHTGLTEKSNFNQLTPGYYYRFNEDGSFSDGASCGNETASERPMMRKFMFESMLHWCREYHLDGFRMDLMGLHDLDTINTITWVLQKEIDKSIFVYGEGWTGGDSPLPYHQRAVKVHGLQLEEAAVFSDDIRDALKGRVFDHKERGFVSGATGKEDTIRFGVVGATHHKQVDYNYVQYAGAPFAQRPSQCINYASCHDNHTLYDRLRMSTKTKNKYLSDEQIGKMHRLANAIVLTSQGVPFLHAGAELMRTKNNVENSYKSPEKINWIDWSGKEVLADHYAYYRALIHLRRNHPAFRMPTEKMIQDHLTFFDGTPLGVVAFQISGFANGDEWEQIIVVYNTGESAVNFSLPDGSWTWVVREMDITPDQGEQASGTIIVSPISMAIVMK